MQAAKPSSRGTFGGDLSAFSLFEVCQFLMIVRQTGTLTIKSASKSATVAISEGQIITVVDDLLKEGEEAFHRVVLWTVGSFQFSPGPVSVPAKPQIDVPTDGLLLEAARRLDEGESELDGESDSPPEGTWTSALLANQRFASEFKDLLSSLEGSPDDNIDFEKDVSIEKLLAVAVGHRATHLFLHIGEPLKIRVGGDMLTVGKLTISQRVLDRLARNFFRGDGRSGKGESNGPSTGEKFIEGFGPVQIEVRREAEVEQIAITVLDEQAPSLEQFGVEVKRLRSLLEAPKGLFLIASPPRGGKSTLAAALTSCLASQTRRHVVFLQEASRFRLKGDGGFIESFVLPSAGGARHSIPDHVWRRKADAIVLDAVRFSDHAEAAVQAAEGGALVIAAVDATDHSRAIRRFLSPGDGDHRSELAGRLADVIVGILVVSPKAPPPGWRPEPNGAASYLQFEGNLLPTSPALTDAIREDDTAALKALLLNARVDSRHSRTPIMRIPEDLRP